MSYDKQKHLFFATLVFSFLSRFVYHDDVAQSHFPFTDVRFRNIRVHGNSQVCAPQVLKFLFHTFLPSQEWRLPILSGKNSVYPHTQEKLMSAFQTLCKTARKYWRVHDTSRNKTGGQCKGTLLASRAVLNWASAASIQFIDIAYKPCTHKQARVLTSDINTKQIRSQTQTTTLTPHWCMLHIFSLLRTFINELGTEECWMS